MDFTTTQRDYERHIQLSGQFTFADSPKFKQIIELVQEKGIEAVEIDFHDVDFIDSAGLGMLLLFRDECQSRRISVSLHSARGQVEKIFMISKFDQLFSMNMPR